jgi:heterodisulfide reductase subunit B
MTLALMRCCATAPLLEQYEAATDALLATLGIGVADLEFNCCGYPLRNSRFDAYVQSSARNLALAERERLDLVTMCSCCYGSLKHVDQLLRTNEPLRRATNAALEDETLRCSGTGKVRHILQVLHEDVGLERLRRERSRTFEGLKVACHYGCHLLRPSEVTQFDDPTTPSILDRLVETTGAQSVPWAAKLDCCGSPVWGVNDALSLDLTERKLRSARESGADVLCVVCPYCHLQLERAQRTILAQRGGVELPVILVHQLLGLSLGVPAETLGWSGDRPPLAAAGTQRSTGARHG